MSYTDLVIVYVVLAGVFICAVIGLACWRFAYQAFCAALDARAKESQ